MVCFCPFSQNDESVMLSVVAARWSSIDLHDRRVSGREWYWDSRMNLARSILVRPLSACGWRVISSANIEQRYAEKRCAMRQPGENQSNKQASAHVAEARGFVARPIAYSQSQLTVDPLRNCLSRRREPQSKSGHTTGFQNGPGSYDAQIADHGVHPMVSQPASTAQKRQRAGIPCMELRPTIVKCAPKRADNYDVPRLDRHHSP